MEANWIDLVILIVFIVFAVEGIAIGFFYALADFLSFLLSLLVALRFYPEVSNILLSSFSLGAGVSKAAAFVIVAVVSEAFFGLVGRTAVSKVPTWLRQLGLLRLFGIFPSIGQALIIVSFVLALVLTLPISPKIKSDITNSSIGSILISQTSAVEREVSRIFGDAAQESLTYIVTQPGSRELIRLQSEIGKLEINLESEKEIFDLTNNERRGRGVHELIWDENLVQVARAHATDMWQRRYFAHYSPEGKDVGDRLDEANISYFVAGENLALAPTVATAHTGLMSSEGHRKNILDDQFVRVGMGVIDNGVYGKMFVQVFTN